MIWNEILCLGDSITYGARDEFGRSPPVELAKILTEKTGEVYVCHNHGISGETSSDLLRRSWSACKSNSNAFIGLLMIGTNDTQANIPLDIYEDNLRQIINMMKIHKMHVIIATLPQLGFTPIYYKNCGMISEYNKVIKKVAKDMSCDICDMSNTEKYYIDGVHYTHEGTLVLAKKWAEAIITSRT